MTTASLHIHPSVAGALRTFEVRRLARESGCVFIPTKTQKKHRLPTALFDPNDGGHAA